MADMNPDDGEMEYIPLEDISKRVVFSMFTSTAGMQLEPDGPVQPMLSLEAMTTDGKEHNLLIPLQGALTLHHAIANVAAAAIGYDLGAHDGPLIPDSPEGINWNGEQQ